MRDPVITLADGHSYERSAIEGWLREGIRVSPTTGLDLKNMKLVPNRALRDAILEWVGEHARREEEKVIAVINLTNLIFDCLYKKGAKLRERKRLNSFYPICTIFRTVTTFKFRLCV